MRELVLRLASPVTRRRRDERGAIGVIVALLIGCGVLLGMGALVIDVGQLYQNRAELQNGADAGALAVASSCARGTCATTLAGTYATGNASALTSHMAANQVCGIGSLGACAATMAGCPQAPANGANWVDVLDSTLTGNASNPTLLPPFLARTLLGNGSYDGTNVKACAQAEWGPARQSGSLAFTLSLCAWDGLAANPYGTEIAIVEHGKAKACSLAPSGLNLPGGFGWLSPNPSPPNPPCTATISMTPPPASTFITGSDPGNNISADCQTALRNDVNTVVYLPVFNGYTGNGSNATYTVTGIAAFYLNGWVNMNPLTDAVPPGMTDQQAQNLCAAGATGGTGNGNGGGNSNRCLLGYFTKGIVPVTGGVGPPGTNDFGAEAVQLTG